MKLLLDNRIYFFDNVETLLLALIAFTIPLPINIGNIAIIISAVYAFFLLLYRKASFTSFKSFIFLFPIALFIIAAISALSSKDINEGVSQLEKLLLMVLIPFIILVFKKRNINLFKILWLYITGTSFATLLLLIINVYKIFSGNSYGDLFFFEFTELYGQHPVYYSTNLVLSIFLIAHNFITNPQKFLYKKVAYLLIVINFTGLMFCASKAVLTCFIFLFVIYTILRQSVTKKLILLTGIILATGVLSFIYVPYLNKRITEGLTYNSIDFSPTTELLKAKKFTYKEKTNISDLELRLIFFKIGLYHTLNDNNLLLGYGLGDVQNYLDYYYMTYNLAPNWYQGDNLHNQYLQYFATYGIIGLLFLIIYLLYSLFIALKYKNVLHLLFILMIFFVFIFEVYFARNKGIVFFFYFNSVFLLYNQLKLKKINAEKNMPKIEI